MHEFFWAHGHLGWGVFTLVVFTGLWWLAADVYWRMRNTRITRHLFAMSLGWIAGVALVVLAFHFLAR